jgi:peptide/nickel transport system substrate-binding protein
MALQSGELDTSGDIPAANLGLFQDKSKYAISSTPSSRVIFLYYNFKRAALALEPVRRAINQSIDKETYSRVLLNNTTVPATGLFPDYLPYSGKRLKALNFDLDAAKAALDEAGYKISSNGIRQKDGQNLSLNILTYTSRVELPILTEAIQSQLNELGFEVKVEIMESVEDRLQSGDFDIVMYSYVTTPLGDPQSILSNLVKSDGSGNMGKYSDSESDKLLDQLAVEFNPDKRSELAVLVQQRALDQNAFGFLVHMNLTQISKTKVINFERHPSDMYGVTALTDVSQ